MQKHSAWPVFGRRFKTRGVLTTASRPCNAMSWETKAYLCERNPFLHCGADGVSVGAHYHSRERNVAFRRRSTTDDTGRYLLCTLFHCTLLSNPLPSCGWRLTTWGLEGITSAIGMFSYICVKFVVFTWQCVVGNSLRRNSALEANGFSATPKIPWLSFLCQEPWSLSWSKSIYSTPFHLNYVGSILIFFHPRLGLLRSWVYRSRICMRFILLSPCIFH